MLPNLHSLCWVLAVFVLPGAVLINPPDNYANAPDPEEVTYMKTRHTKADGVVTQRKSGLYTVKTTTGTNYTLSDSVAVRYGHEVPEIGDEMILWIDEGNHIMDSRKTTASKLNPHFISGKLLSINYGQAQLMLFISGDEKSFKMRPESRMFTDIAVGTPVTIAVNEVGEVINLKVDRDVPISGLNHPSNDSALKGFRHLGKPE